MKQKVDASINCRATLAKANGSMFSICKCELNSKVDVSAALCQQIFVQAQTLKANGSGDVSDSGIFEHGSLPFLVSREQNHTMVT